MAARREGYSTTEDVSGFKGIIGVSFHQRGDTADRFYIRPENSPLNNQLFRNRTTQYESSPDYPWHRLRSELPGLYESYVDIEPGAWTKMKIVIAGTTARLYVNDAAQPVLVVNDLKRGVSGGLVALWAHVETDAYFGAVTLRPASP